MSLRINARGLCSPAPPPGSSSDKCSNRLRRPQDRARFSKEHTALIALKICLGLSAEVRGAFIHDMGAPSLAPGCCTPMRTAAKSLSQSPPNVVRDSSDKRFDKSAQGEADVVDVERRSDGNDALPQTSAPTHKTTEDVQEDAELESSATFDLVSLYFAYLD